MTKSKRNRHHKKSKSVSRRSTRRNCGGFKNNSPGKTIIVNHCIKEAFNFLRWKDPAATAKFIDEIDSIVRECSQLNSSNDVDELLMKRYTKIYRQVHGRDIRTVDEVNEVD